MNRNKSNGNTNGNSNGNGNGNSNSMKNMKGGAAAPVLNYDARAPNDVLNAGLFQIVSGGINRIVSEIKAKLGHDITTTNDNAKKIMGMFNNLERYIIQQATRQIGRENIGDRRQNIIIEKGANGYDAIEQNYDNMNQDANIIQNAQTLNREIITNENPIRYSNLVDGNEVPYNQGQIENRLKNCQNLEVLYLIKHKELMTTFAFTLNLFDKYKYAVKIILFLLKNLVNKRSARPNPDPDPDPYPYPKIKIPQPLIKNIGALVRDQQKVQGIIDTMKKTLVQENVQDNEVIGIQKEGDALTRSKKVINPLPTEADVNTRLKNPSDYPNESPLQRNP